MISNMNAMVTPIAIRPLAATQGLRTPRPVVPAGPLLILLALTYWPVRTAVTAPARTSPAPVGVGEGTVAS